MPPVSRDPLPNDPLDGAELKAYSLHVFDPVARERLGENAARAIAAFKLCLDNDCFFLPRTAYQLPSFEITVKIGEGQLLIRPRYHFPHMKMFEHHEPFVRPFPLARNEAGEVIEEQEFEPFVISAKVDSPNLVRVHLGLPIVTFQKIEPGPGEMVGRYDRVEHRYDPAEYPPLTPPTVVLLKDFGKPAPVAQTHVLLSPSEMIAKTNAKEVIQNEGAATPGEPTGDKAPESTEGGAAQREMVTAPPDPTKRPKRNRRAKA